MVIITKFKKKLVQQISKIYKFTTNFFRQQNIKKEKLVLTFINTRNSCQYSKCGHIILPYYKL